MLVLVFAGFFQALAFNPIGQHLDLLPPGFVAFAPANVRGEDGEVEVAGLERGHVGAAPEGFVGEIFEAFLGARRVGLGGEAVEGDGAFVVDEAETLAVAARIGDHVGIDRAPVRAENLQRAAEVGEVVAQLDDADEIELAEDFREVMNGRVGAPAFAKGADVPGGDVERLVNFRGRNCRGRDAVFEREQALGDFLGDFSVVHSCPGWCAHGSNVFGWRKAKQVRVARVWSSSSLLWL